MNKYTGVYKCRLCGERFADQRHIVEARNVLDALHAMESEHPISGCINCKSHDDGIMHGYGELIGVVEE
jgi:hypothetical protein